MLGNYTIFKVSRQLFLLIFPSKVYMAEVAQKHQTDRSPWELTRTDCWSYIFQDLFFYNQFSLNLLCWNYWPPTKTYLRPKRRNIKSEERLFLCCAQKETMREPNLKVYCFFGRNWRKTGIELGTAMFPYDVGSGNSQPEWRAMIKVRNQ